MKKILLALNIILFTALHLQSEEFISTKSENFNFLHHENLNIDKILEYCETYNKLIDKELKLSKKMDSKRDIYILNDKESFNKYLDQLTIPERDDYIFLKYSSGNSRIIIYSSELILFSSLSYYLTLQYFQFFGQGTPFWFSSGVATYFQDNENIKINNDKMMTLIKSSNYKNKIFTTVTGQVNSDPKNYLNWIVFDYLLHATNKEHNRLFWDSLSIIKYEEPEMIDSAITSRFKEFDLDNILLNYANEIKTFSEFMAEGISFYNKSEFDNSLNSFLEATKISEKNYSPFYYIAACYSNLKMYNEAYSNFSKALDLGAPEDLVYYSIGVNFFNSKDYLISKKYLNKIENSEYKIKAESLIDEISKL